MSHRDINLAPVSDRVLIVCVCLSKSNQDVDPKPEPVCAQAIRSRPDSTIGIEYFCTSAKFELHKLQQSKSNKSPTLYLHMNRNTLGLQLEWGDHTHIDASCRIKNLQVLPRKAEGQNRTSSHKFKCLKCFTLLNTSSKSTKRLVQGNAI